MIAADLRAEETTVYFSPHRRTLRVVGHGDRRSAKVAQAQGMVSVQVQCSLDEALALLKARGESSLLSLDQVAGAVIEGSIRFD
jgi:hypothetical protein